MSGPQASNTWKLAALLEMEYPRLVRLCQQLVRNSSAGEELAQETLIEAWRHAEKLRDPSGASAWLSAIARHVCQRWLRAQGREQRRLAPWEPASLPQEAQASDPLSQSIEAAELAAFLAHALTLLPPETRALLEARYLQEAPIAGASEPLPISANALAVRLHRGRGALRRLLERHFPGELATYGLAPPTHATGWQETRIWCPMCGQRKLVARIAWEDDDVAFRCPECWTGEARQIARTHSLGLSNTLTSYKAILSRQLTWLNRFYRQAMTQPAFRCYCCGGHKTLAAPHTQDPDHLEVSAFSIQIFCADCGWVESNSLAYLVFDLPETQRFWRSHPKMRLHPERIIEQDGRPIVITTFASAVDGARLDVLSAADTLEVVSIHTF